MNFYESISDYYDDIFPITEDKLNFVRSLLTKPPKTILDVACGSGAYSISLSEIGYTTFGVDLDLQMIEKAKQKIKNKNLDCHFFQGNMLELTKQFDNTFDLVFCIGNSLVHLNSIKEIELFIQSIYQLLNKGGTILIQIINFNRVLNKEIKKLPTIKNDKKNLTFERYYHHELEKNKIYFQTILTIDHKKIENNIPLIPMQSEKLLSIIEKVGFINIKTYGDFKLNEYVENESYALLITATK